MDCVAWRSRLRYGLAWQCRCDELTGDFFGCDSGGTGRGCDFEHEHEDEHEVGDEDEDEDEHEDEHEDEYEHEYEYKYE